MTASIERRILRAAATVCAASLASPGGLDGRRDIALCRSLSAGVTAAQTQLVAILNAHDTKAARKAVAPLLEAVEGAKAVLETRGINEDDAVARIAAVMKAAGFPADVLDAALAPLLKRGHRIGCATSLSRFPHTPFGRLNHG